MTLRVSDWQSESDQDSIRSSCYVLLHTTYFLTDLAVTLTVMEIDGGQIFSKASVKARRGYEWDRVIFCASNYDIVFTLTPNEQKERKTFKTANIT